MNAIAGILIGLANDSWTARLLAPFGWGILWCLQHWLRGSHRSFILNRHSAGRGWGLNEVSAFYSIEYATAAVTSLIFSAAAGGLKSLFW